SCFVKRNGLKCQSLDVQSHTPKDLLLLLQQKGVPQSINSCCMNTCACPTFQNHVSFCVHFTVACYLLRVLLETEEQQYFNEIEKRMETALQERQAKMVEKAKVLRDLRETKRQQMVSEKMEQLFVNQCEEVRSILTKRKDEETRLELAAQVHSNKEQQQLQQMKDRRFAEMWEATHQMEVQRENERAQRQQQKTMEHLNQLRAQMEAAEQQRQLAKQLKEEEARLLCEQKEMLKLQVEREKQQRLIAQQTVRRQLDQSYRMKMKRLAKEQQEELALDMSILQQVLTQETDEKQEAAQKKNELREQQQRYRLYLADELEKQKREEKETDLLIEEKLRETWAKREKQSQMEREARNRLMKDVLEGRSLQTQHKRKTTDNFTKTGKTYRADLQAQIQHQQNLKQHEKALEEREVHYGLAVQHEYERMKERVLSRPMSHTTALHPFRHSDGAKSAPSQHHKECK
uniref:Cilia- and flagella-associated protein 53 n=1 Tax=Neogobius melanostomus TaxID=47308 RepID=A0A8C6UZE1_9GOBI